MSNHYEILGVEENASADEIKKAYRKLSLQYHPDRNNNSAESTTKFQNISAAYEILSDDNSRRNYDMQLHMPNGGMQFSPGMQFPPGMNFNMGGNGMPTFFTTNVEIDPADIFSFFSSNIFGGGGGGMRNMFNMENIKQKLAKPTPIIKTETITLSKAYTGYNMPIEITRWIVENDLKREETETIYLPIPRGVDNNEIIIIREKGNSLSENNKGDIKVFIKIQNDTEFERNGLDLTLNKTISLKDALCGFTFDMNYLDGRVFKLNNNAGNIVTHNYNKLIQGLGMKREEHTGNLIINFSVTFPDKLTEKQIDTLRNIL